MAERTPLVSGGSRGSYSAVADAQLDALESDDPDLYNDVVDICERIFADPGRAQSMSAALRTEQGIVLRLAVAGHHPMKIFWTRSGPRIEAVLRYP